MRKTKLSVLALISLGSATLLLTSCASVVEVAETSKPESQITQSPPSSEVVTRVAGDYITYESFVTSGDKYADSKVVLFFNAPWCSTCKQARDNFESDLNEIPDNLTVVVVYFANAFELRKKYGVTVQHTFVQINNAGDALGKWSGSITYDEIVKNLA